MRGIENHAIGFESTKAGALAAMGLNVAYERGSGSALWTRGSSQPVWDFVGGYGAAFFGHNHPALVGAAAAFLQHGGVVHGQASTRAASAALCARLSERLHASTGRQYDIVLGNTGSEATELAARHADLLYSSKREAALAWSRASAEGTGSIEWSAPARVRLAELGISAASITYEAVQARNARILGAPPIQLALQRSFHGCTARALELTWDPAARFGARISAPAVTFIDPTSGPALQAELARSTEPLLRVMPGEAGCEVESLDWTAVTAFFLEPLQGEGGIHPIDGEIARVWQDACRKYHVPVIADEIQSGMGRTGAFLFCEHLGLAPDYILLGKSLGGGLAKISAAAIATERRVPSFALQYTSTFAEDDLSSTITLRALDLLEEEDALCRARERGVRLRAALQAVVERHPTVLSEVRGSGLMLGLEWRRMQFRRSAALRFLQRYDLLGYTIAGYLLQTWGVRVAPALSQGSTMRLEPAYALPDEAIAQLAAGVSAVCALLEREDGASVLAPALGAVPPLTPMPRVRPAVLRRPASSSHVAFVGHFIDADDVALWDASFERLDHTARRTFLNRLRPFAEPLVCHRDHVRSARGSTTTLTFIGIPVSSEQCYEAMRGTARHEMRALIQRALDLAVAEGCSVVGLGGYCSILTRNGKTLRPHGMALTTGNGLTVGAALLTLKTAAAADGVPLRSARAAVVGATGNIGSVLATLLAEDVAALTLLARATRLDELYLQAGRVLTHLVRHAPAAPILHALRAIGFPVAADSSELQLSHQCRAAMDMLGSASPIVVGCDLDLCRDAQLILTASNQSAAILLPQHLAHATTIVVDLAVPGDVHPSVEVERPHALVFRGGVMRTPRNPGWRVAGIPLPPGEMFACMAETALMGLENERAHGSFGALTPERVRRTVALARRHGFTHVRTSSDDADRPRTRLLT